MNAEMAHLENEVDPDLLPQYKRVVKELRSAGTIALAAGLVFGICFFTIQMPPSDLMLASPVFWTMLICLFSLVRVIASLLNRKRVCDGNKQFQGAITCALEIELRALPFNPGITEVRVVNQPENIKLQKGWTNFLRLEPIKETESLFFAETKPITVSGRIDKSFQQLLSVENETIHLCRKYLS